MFNKKNVIAFLILSVVSGGVFAETGSFDKICSQRSGKSYKNVVIESLNVGADAKSDASSSNIKFSNYSSWAHVEHERDNLQSFLRIAYFTGAKLDICLSDNDGRVMVVQGN